MYHLYFSLATDVGCYCRFAFDGTPTSCKLSWSLGLCPVLVKMVRLLPSPHLLVLWLVGTSICDGFLVKIFFFFFCEGSKY